MKKECYHTEIVTTDLKKELLQEIGMDVFSSEEIISDFTFKAPFRSSAFVILLLTNGEMNFNYDFDSYTIKKKEVFFITPGALCETKSFSPDISFIGLVFTPGYLKKQGVVLSSANFIHIFSSNMLRKQSLSEEEYAEILFHILSLKRKMQLPTDIVNLKEIVRHNFISVLYEVFLIQHKHSAFYPVKKNRKEELTRDFLTSLTNNFQQERKVLFYAKALFVTPRHLSQVVKQVTGKTAGEFIDEIVIKEAKVLLSANSFNISQVTNVLNFSDQSFFGKFFKKHTGISPSDYKENNSLVSNPPF